MAQPDNTSGSGKSQVDTLVIPGLDDALTALEPPPDTEYVAANGWRTIKEIYEVKRLSDGWSLDKTYRQIRGLRNLGKCEVGHRRVQNRRGHWREVEVYRFVSDGKA